MKATVTSQSFDEWIAKEYNRLRERLSMLGVFDEDAFHDAYISVKTEACKPHRAIGDFTDIFKREYKRISKRNVSEAFVSFNPDERFFTMLADNSQEEVRQAGRERKRDKLANDIRRHVRDTYKPQFVLLFDTHIIRGASLTDTMAITGMSYRRCKDTLLTMTSEIRNQYHFAI